MEYIVIWLLISIEKFTMLFSKGSTLAIGGAIIIAIIYAAAFGFSSDKESFTKFTAKSKKYRVIAGMSIVIGLFMWTFSFILPDRKELAVIIGGGMTYSVLTSTEAKDIGGKSIQIIRNKLDEVLKDQNDNSHSNIVVPPSDKVVPKDANYKPASLTDDVSTVTGIDINQTISTGADITKKSVDVTAYIIKNKIDDITGSTTQVAKVKPEVSGKSI